MLYLLVVVDHIAPRPDRPEFRPIVGWNYQKRLGGGQRCGLLLQNEIITQKTKSMGSN